MADFNLRVTLLAQGANVRHQAEGTSAPVELSAISFAGTDSRAIRAYRVGSRRPIWRTSSSPNPAYETANQAVTEALNGWNSCRAQYSDPIQRSTSCEPWWQLYQRRKAARDQTPRTITRTYIAGYETVRQVNERAVQPNAAVLYVLQHAETTTLGGFWPEGSTIDVSYGGAHTLDYTFVTSSAVNFATVDKLRVDANTIWCVIPVAPVVLDAAVGVPANTSFGNDDVYRARQLWAYRDSEESEEYETDDVPPKDQTRYFATYVTRFTQGLLDDALLRSRVRDPDGRYWELIGADRIGNRDLLGMKCRRDV